MKGQQAALEGVGRAATCPSWEASSGCDGGCDLSGSTWVWSMARWRVQHMDQGQFGHFNVSCNPNLTGC